MTRDPALEPTVKEHTPRHNPQSQEPDDEFSRPVPRFVDFKRSHGQSKDSNKAYQWYKHQPWDEWWDEFNTAIDEHARPRYRTAWQFCCAKTEDPWQRRLLWEMIGPDRPAAKALRAPWLGDWQKRRANGYWALEPDKVRTIQAALKERQDAIESARALAPLVAMRLQRWHRLQELIDTAFGGQPYLENLPVNNDQNRERIREYIRLQRTIDKQIDQLCKVWWQTHGMPPAHDGQAWVNMLSLLAAGGKIGAAAALTGATAGANAEREKAIDILGALGLNKFDVLFAQDLRKREERYPALPSLTGGPATIPGETVAEEKPNGKRKTV